MSARFELRGEQGPELDVTRDQLLEALSALDEDMAAYADDPEAWEAAHQPRAGVADGDG